MMTTAVATTAQGARITVPPPVAEATTAPIATTTGVPGQILLGVGILPPLNKEYPIVLRAPVRAMGDQDHAPAEEDLVNKPFMI